MREENILYWLWLSECFGTAPKDFGKFVSKFDSPYEVYTMSDAEIRQIDGITPTHRARLCEKSLESSYKTLKHCKQNGIKIIPYVSAAYPSRLREIEDPPVLLYCLGNLPRMDERLCIGMVGTRNMSEYGSQTAYKISYELAAAGACIVSGMALGIDGVCACGAIEAGGSTVAVLGCGVSVVYPAEHKKLMKCIAEHGAVISEYPPLTAPEAKNFPPRNRIISGLSHGVVIVEAAKRSGALITASRAMAQGRGLFAVPGKIGDVQSAGPNDLIRKGANVALCAEDILRQYEFLYGHAVNKEKLQNARISSTLVGDTLERYGVSDIFYRGRYDGEVKERKPKARPAEKEYLKTEEAPLADLSEKPRADLSGLDDTARAVYAALPEEGGITPDKISEIGISVNDAISALTMLEILGLAVSVPGGAYKKT